MLQADRGSGSDSNKFYIMKINKDMFLPEDQEFGDDNRQKSISVFSNNDIILLCSCEWIEKGLG